MTARALLRAALGAIAVAVATAPASAGEDTLRVDGAITGTLAAHEAVSLRITAHHPGGWQRIATIGMDLRLHDASLERMVLDVQDGRLLIGTGRIIVGTANTISGTYLSLSGLDLATTTQGSRIEIRIDAELLRALPPRTRFVFEAEDADGHLVQRARPAQLPPPEGGVNGGVIVAAVLGALLVGGLVGARVGGNRRVDERPSVYRAVQRRIGEPPA